MTETLPGQTTLFDEPAVHKKLSQSEEAPQDVPMFHIVLAPDQGEVTVEPYSSVPDGTEALYKILQARDDGQFSGEIIAFVGSLVEYTTSVPSRRITIPTAGVFEVKDKNAFMVISDSVIDVRK